LLASLSACTPTLLIPNLGLREKIVYGDQSTIDSGYVTDVTGWCPFNTRHLAGHRSGVFSSLPSLRVGNHLVIYEDSTAKDYVLTQITHDYTCDGVWGDLVLQTSHPNGGAYYFHFERN
jgi:hypothetical protein